MLFLSVRIIDAEFQEFILKPRRWTAKKPVPIERRLKSKNFKVEPTMF